MGEQGSHHDLRVIFFIRQRWAEVQVFIEKLLVCAALFFYFGAECGQALGMATHIFQAPDACLSNATLRVLDQVSHQAVQDALYGLIELQLIGSLRINALDFLIEAFENRDAGANIVERKQARLEPIIEIGGVISNFIGQVDELRLERRPFREQILREFRELRRIIVPRVLDDSFAHFKGEIQAAEGSVANLKVLDDAQRVQIVIKRQAPGAHGSVEGLLSGMSEGWVADVVYQRQRLYQVDVQAQGSAYGARDLGDFESMREPVAEVVGVASCENLGFCLKAA